MHVAGKENPADILSRGLTPDALITSDKWWHGPSFLYEPDQIWCQNNFACGIDFDSLPELKSNTVSLVCQSNNDHFPFERFSLFNRMRRTVAYVLRFIKNCRIKIKLNRETGPLTVDEINGSTTALARISQRQSFLQIHDALLKNVKVKSTPNVSSLNIFLDANKLIRVGGRLSNSIDFSFDKKHPILLCGKHAFTRLLFQHEHKRLLHAGPQLLLSTIRDEWWPLRGRNLARQVVYQCVACTRVNGKTMSIQMGNLPQTRLEPGFPFLRCGVDYAGPMFILNRKGRGAKLEKCYICLFVCFTTRAVHLELVTSLSTEAFLLALKRFISRRGKPQEIFSDNGKNFVGAMKEFSNFLKFLISQLITVSNLRLYPPTPPISEVYGREP